MTEKYQVMTMQMPGEAGETAGIYASNARDRVTNVVRDRERTWSETWRVTTMAQDPRTPTSSSPFRPHTSSPLSESFSPSPSTSAAAKLQSRRLAQYKSTASATPRRVSSAYSSRPKTATLDDLNFGVRLFSPVSPSGDAYPRSALLRDRLRQRFARRAQQAREKRVEQKRERRKHGLSSDGEDMSMDSEDENDEDIGINDEVVANNPIAWSFARFIWAGYTFSCFVG
jgi:hypothetical protein